MLIYDDFQRENEANVRRVLRFLDVEDTYPTGIAHVNISTHRVRFTWLNDLSRVLKQGRGPLSASVKAAGRALMSDQVRRRILWPAHNRIVYGKPRAPDEGFIVELRRRFKPEVEALSEYMDRDLIGLWGYDQLG